MMKNMTPNNLKSNRRRGSTIILVVVVIVLLTLMGAAYLQIASVQRLSVDTLEGNIDAVEAAVLAQIQQVLKDDVMDQDANANGVSLFNPERKEMNGIATGFDEPYDYPWRDWNNLSGEGVTFEAKKLLPVISGLPTQDIPGGAFDDIWLSSIMPEDVGSNILGWRKVTVLNPVVLHTGGKGELDGNETIKQPSEEFLQNPGGTFTDMLLPLQTNPDNTHLVDTDLDGIPDSYWTWAPIPQINGVAYTMAVRIVDLSALININTATALTIDGQNATLGDVRGYFPTDADISRLLHRTNSAYANGEVADMLSGRGFTSPVTIPTPLGISGNPSSFPSSTAWGGSSSNRVGTWMENSVLYSGNPNLYGLEDEFELRYANGLNRSTYHSPLEDRMPELMRRDSADEKNFTDVSANAEEFFYGIDPVGNGFVKDWQFNEIRKFLTGQGGSAVYSANHDRIHGTGRTEKFDLVYRGLSNDYATDGGTIDGDGQLTAFPGGVPAGDAMADRVERLARHLERIFGVTDTGSTANAYLGLEYDRTNPSALDGELIKQIALEYALAIQHYSTTSVRPAAGGWIDLDENGLRDTNPGQIEAVTFYGIEGLPFVREVYAQVGYDDNDFFDENGLDTRDPISGAGPPDGVYDTWTVKDQSQAMAIEIGNPFDRPIRINFNPTNAAQGTDKNDIRIIFRNVTGAGAVEEVMINSTVFDVLDSTGAVITAPEYLEIPAGGRVIIYSDPQTPVEETNDGTAGGTKVGTMLQDLGFLNDYGNGVPATILKASDGTFTFPVTAAADFANAQIELQVLVAGDNGQFNDADDRFVTYDRFTIDQLDFPNEVVRTVDTASPGKNATMWPAHAQGSVARDGQGWHYVTNHGKGVVTGGMRNPDHAGYRFNDGVTSNDPKDGLNRNAKTGITGDPDFDDFQIPVANRPIFSVSELGFIHMFGFYEDPANPNMGDLPQRLSGPDNTQELPVLRRTLDLRNDTNTVVPTSVGLPHAAMVFDQFTTLSPRYDGVDNDNSGVIDDEDELFVLGTYNINTMPTHLATLVAALPEADMNHTQALMQQIADYRDSNFIPGADRTAATGGQMTNYRTMPGIASIGELMYVVSSTYNAATPANMRRYGVNGSSETGTNLDLYPMPEMPSAMHRDVADGPEETLSRFQFLAQNFTTRSDRFVAYIWINGYNAADFHNGGDGPLEAVRLMVVFDRSTLQNGDSKVKIMGIHYID